MNRRITAACVPPPDVFHIGKSVFEVLDFKCSDTSLRVSLLATAEDLPASAFLDMHNVRLESGNRVITGSQLTVAESRWITPRLCVITLRGTSGSVVVSEQSLNSIPDFI